MRAVRGIVAFAATTTCALYGLWNGYVLYNVAIIVLGLGSLEDLSRLLSVVMMVGLAGNTALAAWASVSSIAGSRIPLWYSALALAFTAAIVLPQLKASLSDPVSLAVFVLLGPISLALLWGLRRKRGFN